MAVPPVSTTISHSPRSLRDRTRREDRHLKFYELRDNLRRRVLELTVRGSVDLQEDRVCAPRGLTSSSDLALWLGAGRRRSRISLLTQSLRAWEAIFRPLPKPPAAFGRSTDREAPSSPLRGEEDEETHPRAGCIATHCAARRRHGEFRLECRSPRPRVRRNGTRGRAVHGRDERDP